ncbi:hypothetical protein TNCV_1240911 [Trichonephila clavipes]|uniref:Uncharacterized protein n=1 Tax=Trichonephila clavipes TaxID=2585209 RepID=A0A8X7BIQ0_TRICX|nr:hypothetical protein TNCV_1240911 [Trichonephila clavipes]
MDAMRLSIRLGEYCFTPHKCNLQVSYSSRRPISGSNASSEHVPNMLDWIQIKENTLCGSIRCIISASSMFSTRRALCGRALSSWKTKVSPMAPASVRTPILIPPHTIQPALLYCDFSRTNAGLFRVPLSLHTRTRRVSHSRLNRDSSVNSIFQSCCSQSLFSSPSSLGRTVAWGQRNAYGLAYVHRALPHEADCVLFGWTPFVLLPRATVLQCVAFSVLFRRAVNCIYRSSVDVSGA